MYSGSYYKLQTENIPESVKIYGEPECIYDTGANHNMTPNETNSTNKCCEPNLYNTNERSYN